MTDEEKKSTVEEQIVEMRSWWSADDEMQEDLTYLESLHNAEIRKARADAIEEICKQISERVDYWESCAVAVKKGSNEYKIFNSLQRNFSDLAEQLKEQK